MSVFMQSIRNKKGIRRFIGPKRIIALFILVFILFRVWHYYKIGVIGPDIILNYSDKNPITSIVLFIIIYAVSVIALLPSSPLNLAAGFFWGGILGGLYSAVGVTIGSWISFLLVRWFFGQPFADRFENKWLVKIQQEFDENGWKFVAFARVNPIIPTGPLNYLLGLTSLSNKAFLLSSFIFLIPPSIAVAYIGDSLQTFVARDSDASDVIKKILILSTAVTFLFLIRFFSKIYKSRSDK